MGLNGREMGNLKGYTRRRGQVNAWRELTKVEQSRASLQAKKGKKKGKQGNNFTPETANEKKKGGVFAD